MSLMDRLGEDLKSAMKSGDKVRLETVRLLRAQLKDVVIEKQRALEPEEEIAVLSSAAKKRREAIEAYRNAERPDLLDQETAELAIISEYLPKALSAEELAEVVDAAIREVGATSSKDFGKVMGKVMPQVKGRADGKQVQQIVRERLS